MHKPTQTAMERLLQETGIFPVVVLQDAADAIPVAQALLNGGLPIVEVTLRTDAAYDAIENISRADIDAVVGAGTVLNAGQVTSAADAGAKFIVSPGLHKSVVSRSRDLGLPVFPGIATASEAQAAWNMGLRTLKLFPAEQVGGVAMLKALGSVFRDLKFIPMGGVSTANLAEYLRVPSVAACGGSWLTPATAIDAGDFSAITELVRKAREIADEITG